MRKLALALLATLLLSAGANAQVVTTWPPPAGTIAFLCVYNSSPPSLTSGSPAYAQCDASGNLRVTGTFTITPSGTQNVNLFQYNSLAVPANGLPTQFLGTATFGTNQVSVTSAGVTIAAARTGVVGTGRKSICVTNITGTAPVYVGATGVTTSTGDYIPGTAGAGKCWDTQAAIFGIVSSTSQTVSYTETY